MKRIFDLPFGWCYTHVHQILPQINLRRANQYSFDDCSGLYGFTLNL